MPNRFKNGKLRKEARKILSFSVPKSKAGYLKQVIKGVLKGHLGK